MDCYLWSMNYGSYHDLLNEEFKRRKQLNSSYSLRAFARDLSMPPARLSQILNKKQGLSVSAAKEVSAKLNLTEEEAKWFCCSAGALHSRSNKERKDFEKKIQSYKKVSQKFAKIQMDYFKVISDWYHFAILELTYLQDFQSDMKWIANILDLSTSTVEEAIERMKRLELLKEENGVYIDVFQYLNTEDDIPSLSLKKYHHQLMKKSMEAMYEQDVSNREYASNIISFNKEKLPYFKEKIRKFRDEFDYECGQLDMKDSVYCFSLQFYEITKRSE